MQYTLKKVIRTGSSMPIVVADPNGKEYFVKLKGSGNGCISIVNEWLAVSLGILIGLPVITPTIISITKELTDQSMDPELKELIHKSIGKNMCFPYYAQSSPYFNHNEGLYRKIENLIFLYDCFVLNIDRYPLNTNVIMNHGRLYSVDYGASLFFQGVMEERDYYTDSVKKQLRRNPFYSSNTRANDLYQLFDGIKEHDIKNIVESVPNEWLKEIVGNETSGIKQKLKDQIWKKMITPLEYNTLLNELKMYHIESEELLKRNRKETSIAFQKKYEGRN